MPDQAQRVRVEEIEWSTALPATQLFRSFQTAVHPTKLMTAFLLVVLLSLEGHLLDLVWGARAYQGEVIRFAHYPPETYDRWLSGLQATTAEPIGVYATGQRYLLDAAERLVASTLELRIGFDHLLQSKRSDGDSVIGALWDIFVTLPTWAWYTHKWYMIAFGSIALATVALLGGALARMTALHATTDQRISIAQAMRFARSRWAWFILTPLMPLVLAALVALVPILTGLVLFNVPVLEVLGGVLFIIPLLCGAGIGFLLLLLALGGHLFYPAIAVEGTDGFDAVSRAFGYVLGRPWRWLLYNLIALAYGTLTYLVVGTLVFLATWIAQRTVAMGVLRELSPGVNRFDAMLPPPTLGELNFEADWSGLSIWGKTSAAMTAFWVYLAVLLMGAYAVSFYYSANTWVYLLLRRAVDGTGLDDVFITSEAPTPPDKPAAPAPASTETPSPADTENQGD